MSQRRNRKNSLNTRSVSRAPLTVCSSLQTTSGRVTKSKWLVIYTLKSNKLSSLFQSDYIFIGGSFVWYLIWFFLVGRKSWIGSTSLWWWTACFSISSRRLVSVELLPYFYTPPLCMTRVMHLRWMTSLKNVCINVILLEYAYIWVRTKDKHKS